MISKWIKRFAVAAAGVGNLIPALVAASEYNLQPPQTIIAREIYDLHTLIFLICCVIFVVVFGAMTYSIIMHRKSVGHKAEQFHENTTVFFEKAIFYIDVSDAPPFGACSPFGSG